MKITEPKKYKSWTIQKLQGLVWKLENTGDGDFDKNGELSFVQALGTHFSGKHFVAFDIGANVGEYTDMLLKYVRSDDMEIHLFEPQETCFKTISDTFAENKKIYLNHFGLSDTDQNTLLYEDFDQSGLASVHKRNLTH